MVATVEVAAAVEGMALGEWVRVAAEETARERGVGMRVVVATEASMVVEVSVEEGMAVVRVEGWEVVVMVEEKVVGVMVVETVGTTVEMLVAVKVVILAGAEEVGLAVGMEVGMDGERAVVKVEAKVVGKVGLMVVPTVAS